MDHLETRMMTGAESWNQRTADREAPGEAGRADAVPPGVVEMSSGTGQAVQSQSVQNKQERFASLLERRQSMVFSIAYHWLGSRALAEEISQDVFLDLYRRQPELASDAHEVNYLRRMTVHRLIDHSRKRSSAALVSLDAIEEPSMDARVPDAFAEARLRRLMVELEPLNRMILILRFQEEMTIPEIAAALEIPLGTAKSKLQRTLQAMREKMEADA